VKGRRSYDVAETAATIGVSTATVRAWRKAGLEAVAGIRPAIFRGVDLIAFLKERGAGRKHPCGPGEMYCFSCKEPRSPAFGEAEFWLSCSGGRRRPQWREWTANSAFRSNTRTRT
jgi:hypothetical protein